MKVEIIYNENEEMMKIVVDGESIFFGNYWDFSREPKSLEKLFKKMGVDVSIKNTLPPIG